MIEITEKNKCAGCTACASGCPKKCIEMVPDEEGFLYPKIDIEQCVGCGKCDSICPILNPIPETDFEPTACISQTKEQELLALCTSGGAFSTLAKAFLEDGGFVSGAAYDEDFRVVHIITNRFEDLRRLAGSKYVQSNLNGVFAAIKELLNHGQRVLFCGTPCQTAGLLRTVGERRDGLYLVDLVCHGVPSPALWEQYVSHTEAKRGPLTYVNFRSKNLGYHVSVMEEQHEEGRAYYASARTHLMSKVFFKNIADRPSCYNCAFKTVKRCSDITVFDGWHAEELVPSLRDNDRGYTNLLVQSERGEELLKQYGMAMTIYPCDREKAIALDGSMMCRSVAMHPKRREFLQFASEHGIETAVQRYLPISRKDYLVERSKLVLKRLGILNAIKKIKG